jgi:hypothetical protein
MILTRQFAGDPEEHPRKVIGTREAAGAGNGLKLFPPRLLQKFAGAFDTQAAQVDIG